MINEFKNDFGFLSNFYESKIVYNNKIFSTVEHFFQAYKATNEEDFEKIRKASTPGETKTIGRKINLRKDWDSIKDRVMFIGLLCKFTQHSLLEKKLLDTANVHLEEGNTWGDKYWGTVDGEGKNMLGILLMDIRKILTQK